jgi:hypothetical protein
MSLNLTLVFDRFNQDSILASDKMEFYPYIAWDFHDELQRFVIPLTQRFCWYDDDNGIEDRQTDPYGDPLTFILAHQLAPLIRAEAARNPRDAWSAAVAACVGQMPAMTKIVLWWH